MMSIRFRLVSDAATEPVTLQEALDYARVDVDPGGTVFTRLIAAGRRAVEKQTGLCLITQSWIGVMDNWPSCAQARDNWWDGVRDGPISFVNCYGQAIEIVKRPVQSLTSIAYYDETGTRNVVNPSIYNSEISGDTLRIKLNIGQVWPPIVFPRAGAVEIAFKAGYGDSGAAVPDDLRQAILMLVSHLYETREPGIESGRLPVPYHIGMILDGYRSVRMR